MQEIRYEVVMAIPFFEGKRALFSNIFLGIFASAFCMYIGEWVSKIYLEKELKREINQLFDELWVKVNFKSTNSRQGYIDNAQIFIQYQEKIERLYVNFQNTKNIEYYIIQAFHCMLFYYESIYENEYMKHSNFNILKVYFEKIQNIFGKDLKKFYYLSERDKNVMEMRKDFEHFVNEGTEYKKTMEERVDRYIEEIKKLEKYFNDIYEKKQRLERSL